MGEPQRTSGRNVKAKDPKPRQLNVDNFPCRDWVKKKVPQVKKYSKPKDMTPLQCDYCGEIKIGITALVQHLERHQKLACNVCGAKFNYRCSLVNHLRGHFQQFYCSHCGKTFTNRIQFKRHSVENYRPKKDETAVVEPKVFACKFCRLEFDKKPACYEHEKRLHINMTVAPFECKKCNKIMRCREEYRVHTLKHYKSKKKFCKFEGCNKFFRKTWNLTLHEKIHKEARYECKDCSHKFKSPSGLYKHRRNKVCTKAKPQIPAEEQERIKELAIAQIGELGGRVEGKKATSLAEKTAHGSTVDISSQVLHAIDEDPLLIDEIKSEHEDIQSAEGIHLDASNETGKESQGTFEIVRRPRGRAKKVKPIHREVSKVSKAALPNVSEALTRNKQEKSTKDKSPEPLKDVHKTDKEAVHKPSKVINGRKRQAQSSMDFKEFTCDLCGKIFSNRSKVFTHLTVTHKRTQEYFCDLCDKGFKTRGNMHRHINIVHLKLRTFSCHICGSMFEQKYHLNKHMLKHEEKSKCPICYRLVYKLEKHLERHRNPPARVQSQCPICEKIIHKNRVKSHIESIHKKVSYTGVMFNCDQCDKTYTRREDLRTHTMLDHFKGKLYKCKICPSMFRERKALNHHKRNTHGPKRFKCPACDNVYRTSTGKRRHIMKFHREHAVSYEKVSSLKECVASGMQGH